jgi:predicted Zn-dependent protease
MQQGRHAEVLATYARLPEVLRREKGTLLMRYQAAAQTGEAELLQVVEDFRGYYPDDVCLDFLLVDYHVLRKEHDKALEAIDRLDASVGGDTHLNLLRAESVYQQGDAAKAFELVRKANAADADAIDPYWTLLGLSVMEKDHGKTLACLQRLESRFGMNMGGVEKAPQYADFIASPQGQEWQRGSVNTASQPAQ